MKLTITLFVLINAYFLNAKSLSSDSKSLDNPCTPDNLLTLQFYYPYPKDDTRYIECDPWGEMHVKVCDAGSKWNSWLSSCVFPVPDSQEATQQMNNYTIPEEYCSYFGNYSCLNGGICNQFLIESRCFCLDNYTGYHCEVAKQSLGAFGQLINDSFSLDLYKHQRPLANDTLTFNTSFDTSVILDDAAKQRVQKYLDLFPKGEMRFDTLVNYLVQDFLSQIYPSSFFLNEFLLPGEVDMGYSNAVPNLLQAAQYAHEKFDNIFMIYEQVLDNLIDYLTKYEPKVKQEAQSFFEVYDLIFTKLNANASGSNQKDNRTDLTRDEMKKTIADDFNQTLSWSYDLFRYLNRFDDELSLKNYTTEEMAYAIGNFSMDEEVTKILSEIQGINSEIWDSLSFYGFWYVISSYVDIPDQSKNESGSKRVFERPQALMGESTTTTTEIDYDFSSESSDNDALISDITPKMGQLIGETVTPRAGLLISDVTGTPRAGQMIMETTPRFGQLVGDVTVTPRVGQMIMETTPRFGQLVGDVTVTPRAGLLVGDESDSLISETTVIPGALIGDATVTPRAGLLIGDVTVTPRVGQLVGSQSTTTKSKDFGNTQKPKKTFGELDKKPKAAQLVNDVQVTPRSGLLVGDVTVTPRVGQMIMETTPRSGLLVGDVTVTPRVVQIIMETTPRSGLLVGDVTVTPRVGQMIMETTPRSGLLFGGFTGTPRNGLLDGDVTVTPRAGLLVGDESDSLISETTVIPGALIGDATVTPRVGLLVGDVTPRVGQLVGSQSSTTKSKVQKPKSSQLVGDVTTMPKFRKTETPKPKVLQLIADTTVLPKTSGLSGVSTIVPKVSAIFDETTTVSHDDEDSSFSITF